MSTLFLERPEGRIAYDLAGTGPLVVCVPGMGDLRAEYRFLAERLVAAGFRVATMDVRGHGESDTTFTDVSPAAVGSDIVALLESLDEPAFVVGTSMAAAATVWAAAEAPRRVLGLVLAGPFVRDVPVSAFVRGMLRVLLARPWGRAFWMRYYASLYPKAKPADFDRYRDALRKNLSEPGRFNALRGMIRASKQPCEARIPDVRAPTLVVMGTRDPDFPDAAKEAQEIAARLHGELFLVDGAGHYPHAEMPDVVAPRIVSFLKQAHA